MLKASKSKSYDHKDPYEGFLASFPLKILVETADYIMERYPHLKRVDTILNYIEDDLALGETERQAEERS
jgi:hypothetical protein